MGYNTEEYKNTPKSNTQPKPKWVEVQPRTNLTHHKLTCSTQKHMTPLCRSLCHCQTDNNAGKDKLQQNPKRRKNHDQKYKIKRK